MSALAESTAAVAFPARMNFERAGDYCGGRNALLCLVLKGWLEPCAEGNRNVRFMREEIDTALRIARINGDALSDLPESIRSVSAALAARERGKKRDLSA